MPKIPAAAYLRMSTDLQPYSLQNQMDTILAYAERHEFEITITYSDPAKSGVHLRTRKGLQKLIQDVIQGEAQYRAILVYDVSRWGRFQDTDEAAHYEFMCKSAGVAVHYCAETFVNDGNLSNGIMKSLKRAMAGEYSRELSVKVHAGQMRLAHLGFRQGGQPGYGLRRMLVSSNGTPKQVLQHGEHKSIMTDRVILVPGPPNEVECVREIYRMFIEKGMWFTRIARSLNRRGIKHLGNTLWDSRAVKEVLTHPKYAGCNVYGRYTQRLYTPARQKPHSQWTVIPNAFTPLVVETEHSRAQEIIKGVNDALPRNWSDDQLLEGLRRILKKHGQISTALIQKSSLPSHRAYRERFGSLTDAYARVGYVGEWCGGTERRSRTQDLRDALMAEIIALDPNRVFLEPRKWPHKHLLRLDTGALASVIASRPKRRGNGIRWRIITRQGEYDLVTLVARVEVEGDSIKDIRILPPLGKVCLCDVRETDRMFRDGIKLDDLKDFHKLVVQMSGTVQSVKSAENC